ncbi:MAG: DsbA family protein [Candidatus Woesearchaeota archaeon]
MVRHGKEKKHNTQRDKQVREAKKRRQVKTIRNWTLGILIVGFVFFVGFQIFQTASIDTSFLKPLSTTQVAETDHTKGTGAIVIIEYSDFTCPACAFYAPIIDQLIDSHGDDVTFVYRHFPLRAAPSNSVNAARAVEAAGMQDAFWEMHDLLFERQAQWQASNLATVLPGYARELGLDEDQFIEDYSSDYVRAIVEHQRQHAVQLNLGGTPAFFINGRRATFSGDSAEEIYQNIVNEVELLLR